jgi:hypothetical protein
MTGTMRDESGKAKGRTDARLRAILAYVLYAAVVILILSASWHLFVTAPEATDSNKRPLGFTDRGAILFGTGTIALVFVTLFAGVVAIFGWQKLEANVKRDVEDGIRKRLEKLDTLMRGRVISMLGFAIGELSSEPDQLDATRRDHLAEAVIHCRDGYNLLKKSGDRPAMLMGLNCLVYYASILGDPSQGRYLLEKARTLREAGDEFGIPAWLLTYCRAVLRYSNDPREKEEARAIAGGLLSANLTDQQQKEAKFYLDSLSPRTDTPGSGV